MEQWERQAAKQALDGAKNIWPGCYRGKVESIDDPDRLDRVRVRVWAVHRDDSNTPDSALPWAEVNEIGGGGYDYGGFNPPPVGSGVWVMFEGGNPNFPVVMGTFRGVPKRNADNPNVFLVKDKQPATETAWKPPDEESETPKDVFEDVDRGDPHPTKRVWNKSYKGHTIVVEDGDGKESFKIIDRAGQILEFDCAVDATIGKGNAAQRGVRDATRGDQLPHDAMRDKRAAVRIRDLSGQEIVLDARNQNETLTIRGRSRSGGENRIILRSGKGKNSIEIIDSGGDFFRLDPRSNTPIEIRDSTGNSIVFDKATGAVLITGAKVNEERVQQKKITVGGTKESDIRGDEIKEVLGNKQTKVINDSLSSVLGNAQVSIGGALKLLLTNTSPSGAETTSLDIQLTTGSFSLNIKTLGDITLSTTSGDVELSTLLGDATLSAGLTSGDANVAAPATAGKVILGNSLLTSGPNPVPGLSQESLIRGDFFIQSLDTYITAVGNAWTARATLASAFSAVLTTGLTLNLIPAIGNTLFTILVGAPWLAYAAGEGTSMLAMSLAATTFKGLLTSCKSTKSSTE
jgi:hypothetical protein